MSFNWINYLELAEFLVSHKGSFDEEAGKRSAVSRAYYAAFCHARNYAESKLNFTPSKKAEDHGKVRQKFLQQADDSISEIGAMLQQLRDWRNNCDYVNDYCPDQFVVKAAISTANEIHTLLS